MIDKLPDSEHQAMLTIGRRLAWIAEQAEHHSFETLSITSLGISEEARDRLIDEGMLYVPLPPREQNADRALVSIEGLDYLAHHCGKTDRLRALRKEYSEASQLSQRLERKAAELRSVGRNSADHETIHRLRSGAESSWNYAKSVHREVNKLFKDL